MKTKQIALSLLMFTLTCFMPTQAAAQRPDGEEMKGRRAEMIEQLAERLAKDMDLKGDAKSEFIAQYKMYQNELQATQSGRRGMLNPNADREKKKLSDEEAQNLVDEYFSRQEQQIAQQQKRLEVEKKYYAEFKKTLTPQQLAKIFRQRQNMRQGGQGPRQGGFGGPQGGPRQGGFGGPQGGMGGDF